MFTRPPGDEVHELVVSGTDAVGVLNKITGILSKNNVNFVSNHGQVNEAGTAFTNAFFCDMSRAKVDMERLKRELMSLHFVKDVRSTPMKGMMFESYMFPMSSIFAGRVITVDAAAFADMEDRLKEMFGSAGEAMAYEQGKAYAEATVRDLRKYAELAGAKWDLANVQAFFRAEGWGVVTISETESGFGVRVKDAPQPRNAVKKSLGGFNVGMVVGMLEELRGEPLKAGDIAADGEGDDFLFTVIPAPTKWAAEPSRMQTR